MKYKGIPLVLKPWWWNYIPTLSWCGASAIYPNIILRKDIYDNLKSKRPTRINTALLIHEAKHIERQRKMGKWKFLFLYQINGKFRINEEIIADKARFKYMKKHKIAYDLEERAKMLSSWKYLWGISYKQASQRLLKLYKDA